MHGSQGKEEHQASWPPYHGLNFIRTDCPPCLGNQSQWKRQKLHPTAQIQVCAPQTWQAHSMCIATSYLSCWIKLLTMMDSLNAFNIFLHSLVVSALDGEDALAAEEVRATHLQQRGQPLIQAL